VPDLVPWPLHVVGSMFRKLAKTPVLPGLDLADPTRWPAPSAMRCGLSWQKRARSKRAGPAIKVLLFAAAIRSIKGSVNRIGSLPTAKTKQAVSPGWVGPQKVFDPAAANKGGGH